MAKILIVTTSHEALGDTGQRTGVWVEELATPYYAFLDFGAAVTLASIKGGVVPLDPRSMTDRAALPRAAQRFLADDSAMAGLRAAPSVSDAESASYDAIYLPGGHGCMWDMPTSVPLARIIARLFETGRVIAAVCHGPAGLIGARTADGEPLVHGRKLTSFTDAEEQAAGLDKVVPFLLEKCLRELGADFEPFAPFAPHAVRDGQLITGQNPASSGLVAGHVIDLLRARNHKAA